MATTIQADASPEKRLFISLLTRDIPLVAAFLDLVDNSVNAAVEPYSAKLQTASDYLRAYQNESLTPKVNIHLTVTGDRVSIKDNAPGISAKVAAEHVFKFGRPSGEAHESDRLSVYGIGLKRAIFKLGNKIAITSDHVNGGFNLDLNVSKWEKLKVEPWSFDITPRTSVKAVDTGTHIEVRELYDDTKRRLSDGLFIGQLREAIARTYAFYLAKFVRIYLNDDEVTPTEVEIGTNRATDDFDSEGVSCVITAGIGVPQGGSFRDRAAGWFVFCNGRTVISADKSPLTGWAMGATGLPIFQPKHRAFVGIIFFVSADAELLPWNTTKSGINEDSAIWQQAKRQMIVVGRQVVSFLDSRYTDEGTEISSADLKDAAGERVSVIAASVAPKQQFSPPTRPAPETVKIQYDAKVTDVKKVAKHLGKPYMSGSEVGRHTFEYFVRNEVGGK